jgi:hypothetical protein
MVAHSGPISNSDYIGQPSAHSEAQCKRPAQYSPYWAGLLYWPSHVWMAPDLQEFFRVMNSGRLQSCVRPFSAVSHDRWP